MYRGFHLFIFHDVGEPLALHTCHVQYVGCIYHFGREVSVFGVLYAVAVTQILVFVGHSQLLAGHEMKRRIEVSHSLDERMHRASILQIAHHSDGKILQFPWVL